MMALFTCVPEPAVKGAAQVMQAAFRESSRHTRYYHGMYSHSSSKGWGTG